MTTYIGATIAILVLWHVAFAIAVKLRRNDIADVFWGPSFLVAALAAWAARALIAGPFDIGLTELVIVACVSLWGLRLGYHIGARWRKHEHEDARYAKWRREWGAGWLFRSYWQVFLLQPVFLILIVLPVLRAIDIAPRAFSPLVGVGFAIWLLGFFFESVGDAQLKKFTSDPANKGRIMDRGLWSWSRHPNYFGEVAQWWGVFLMAVEPGGWWLIVSPLAITFLILKVSGVPMLEKMMENRPGFDEYRRRTSIFIPMPPRKA